MIIRDIINEIYPEGILESSLEICRDNKLLNEKLSEIWNSGKVGDEFYKDNYLYSAHLLHQLPIDLPASLINIASHNRSSYIHDIASLFRHTHKNVLDFGAGIGNFGFTFASFGYNVTFADVDSPHFRIVKALSNDMKVDASFANLGHSVHPTQLSFTKYDIVLCIQVLEHVINPEELLSMFHDMLSDNGLLILETFFDDAQWIKDIINLNIGSKCC